MSVVSRSGSDSVLTVLTGSNNLCIMNVHLSSKKDMSLEQIRNAVEICNQHVENGCNAVVIGDFNCCVNSQHFMDFFASQRFHIKPLEPNFFTSYKTRNITNQFDKVNKEVKDKIDCAFIISKEKIDDVSLITYGPHGPLESDRPYDTTYPTDHYGIVLEFAGKKIFSLNILGESVGKNSFNIFEFYPAELYRYFADFKNARSEVNSSAEFSEFYEMGMKLKKENNAYNKMLRNFPVFDVHPPTEDYVNHPYFSKLMETRANLISEFRSQTEDDLELRALGEKMLAYQERLINHEMTRKQTNEWLEFLIANPKERFTNILERNQDVDIFCLQEVNDHLLDFIFEHEFLSYQYEVYSTVNDSTFLITRDNIEEFKQLSSQWRRDCKFKTYGLTLIKK